MKIPPSELNAHGVLCRTKSGKEYQITHHEAKERFTLWRLCGGDAEKLASSGDIRKLYAQIDWSK